MSRHVTLHLRLAGTLQVFTTASTSVVALLSRPYVISPARLAVVDAGGRAASVVLERIQVGSRQEQVGNDVRIESRHAGLAVEPTGRRAFVAAAGGLIAEVDLQTLAGS